MDRERLVYALIHTCWRVKRCASNRRVTVAQLYLYAYRIVSYCSLPLVVVPIKLSFEGQTTLLTTHTYLCSSAQGILEQDVPRGCQKANHCNSSSELKQHNKTPIPLQAFSPVQCSQRCALLCLLTAKKGIYHYYSSLLPLSQNYQEAMNLGTK